MTIVTVSSFDTDYPADTLEFCPTPGFQDLFACGTYKLLDQQEEEIQTRKGQCLVFRMGKGPSQYSM
jgi:diphthamide biosynthesis protein 7